MANVVEVLELQEKEELYGDRSVVEDELYSEPEYDEQWEEPVELEEPTVDISREDKDVVMQTSEVTREERDELDLLKDGLKRLAQDLRNEGERSLEQSEETKSDGLGELDKVGPSRICEMTEDDQTLPAKLEKARKRVTVSPAALLTKTVKVNFVPEVKAEVAEELSVRGPKKVLISPVETRSWKVRNDWDPTKKPVKSILKKTVADGPLTLDDVRVTDDFNLSESVALVWGEEEQTPEAEQPEPEAELVLVEEEGPSSVPREGDSLSTEAEVISNESDGEVSPYARLFSDEELDAMEQCEPGQEGSALAGYEVAVEEEEYDTELEERLYPLDEMELKLKQEVNAEAQKEPTIEDVAQFLDLPLEVVERTREASPGDMSTPEYWQEWFSSTLENTAEARRANRDFSTMKTEENVEMVNSVTIEDCECTPIEDASDYHPKIDSAWGLDVEEEEAANMELLVYENVGESLSEEEVVAAVTDVFSCRTPSVRKVARHPTVKAMAREAVYRVLKEACLTVKRSATSDEKLEANGGRPRAPPLRDKVPELDWERLRGFTEQIMGERGIIGDYWADLSDWVTDYYQMHAVTVWRALWDRVKKNGTLKKWRYRRKRRKKVSFDCSSLYQSGAEALGEQEFKTEDDTDASSYVEVLERGRTNEPVAKSLREAGEVDDGSEYSAVVEDGKRVVCAVGNYEALSSGFIDCLPALMLADTGATLSLVDKTVMRRLGRGAEPLEPYVGRVNSSSGHSLRVRGWASVPIRLGSIEVKLRVLVVDQLHVDAILGVDALGAFGAVIDVEDHSMKLKKTGEVLQLGVAVVEMRFRAALAASVRLPPKSHALVMASVVGRIDEGATVLVEGAEGLSPMFRAARTLGTVDGGDVIAEQCNLSTEEQ